MSIDPDSLPSQIRDIVGAPISSQCVTSINDDDCAVLEFGDRLLVITSDYINASPIVVELGIGDSRTLGALAAAVNLSDLYGTGATPRGFLLSVTLPRDANNDMLVDIVKGASEVCRQHGIDVVGGDTKLGKSLAICGTAFGEASSSANLFLKNRARPGDLLLLSGPIGGCTAAVLGWQKHNSNEKWKSWAQNVLSVPSLPFLQSQDLARLSLSVSGTDLSDGLGMDLSQLCELSQVGAIVEANAIPIPSEAIEVALDLSLPSWTLAFGVGGDFQFVATCPTESVRRAESFGFSVIGEITEELGVFVRVENGLRPLPIGGHSDARNLSFAEEIKFLVLAAAGVEL